jgi:hypothetical protein
VNKDQRDLFASLGSVPNVQPSQNLQHDSDLHQVRLRECYCESTGYVAIDFMPSMYLNMIILDIIRKCDQKHDLIPMT